MGMGPGRTIAARTRCRAEDDASRRSKSSRSARRAAITFCMLRERQEPAGTKIAGCGPGPAPNPTGTLPLARMLLPIGPKPREGTVSNVPMQAAEALRAHIQGCEQLQQIVAKATPGAQLLSISATMRLTDLSPEMQGALRKTQPGEAARAVCIGRRHRNHRALRQADPPKTPCSQTIPTQDEVEQQIYEDADLDAGAAISARPAPRRRCRDPLKRAADAPIL